MAEIPSVVPPAAPPWKRQPVHVVYGGAHLFSAATCGKLGDLARKSLADYAPNADVLAQVFKLEASLAARVYTQVREKLEREPVEDFRVDFEDGFGIRSDAEEDASAEKSAKETAAALSMGSLPPFFGIRVKPFNDALRSRARRTLDLYLATLLKESGGRLPKNFVVTLPKVTTVAEVAELATALDDYSPNIGVEIMIETPQAIFILPQLVAAASDRCTGAHFGAYDYLSSLGITSSVQTLRHQACDFARNMMQSSLAPTGVWLSDGATSILPMPLHRGPKLSGEQNAENRTAVHSAWKLHFNQVYSGLCNGFYQGWDLHPAQLPARYAALHAFFLEGLEHASARLRNFVAAAAQATHVGGVFDDAATGQGLLNYFLRAINCGAIREVDVPRLTGLTLEQLRTGSFVVIAQQAGQQQAMQQ